MSSVPIKSVILQAPFDQASDFALKSFDGQAGQAVAFDVPNGYLTHIQAVLLV